MCRTITRPPAGVQHVMDWLLIMDTHKQDTRMYAPTMYATVCLSSCSSCTMCLPIYHAVCRYVSCHYMCPAGGETTAPMTTWRSTAALVTPAVPDRGAISSN